MELINMSNYYKYWGKAIQEKNTCNYHLLVYHSLDVAAVAWHLLKPNSLRCKDFSYHTGLSPELLRFLIVFALMLHDIGKFSFTFQALVPRLFQQHFPGSKTKQYSERHDTLGFVLWREIIKHDFMKTSKILTELLNYFIKACFGHHGLPPKESARGGNRALRTDSFFNAEDKVAAQNFCHNCFLIPGKFPVLPAGSKFYKKVIREISWNIAGLGVLSDWIGSNSSYFPFNSVPMPLSEYWQNKALPQAANALSDVGWKSCHAKKFSSTSTLISLFPFIHEATPLQTLAVNMSLPKGPKLIIIEDVTGAGKTEAAIVLAARIMSHGDADGIYIGLPTMATTNAMYERMQEAYYKLYADGEKPSLILSHGARHLSAKFCETVIAHKQKNDQLYGVEETASVICNEWYADNRKKSLLADIGIGTIDQALLGVLPARHQSLRLLGLQRKILIVDEVHAYDPYMKHLIEVLLEAHARGGGSVILLSATIPQKKRNDLIKAFYSGLTVSEIKLPLQEENTFPLVTLFGISGLKSYPIDTRREVRRSIDISFFHTYEEVLKFIEEKALAGECVCWIRNTVKDARKTYFDLLERESIYKDHLDLFHSRFAMIDRARIEKNTINNFGKNSGNFERKGRVLIATQVVEQSLDLDFDQMIIDLAPIDLVIQRAGRLHRHIRDQFGNRIMDNNATDSRLPPILHIFAPEFDEKADSTWLAGDFSGTEAVYRNAGNLWLTQKILLGKKGWHMPEDARELIETVYGQEWGDAVPEGLIEKVISAEGEAQSKESMGHLNALILAKGYCRNAVKIDQWNEDKRVPTRLCDENIEVTLAVSDNGKLIPYAENLRYAWDWSCFSVSLRDWEKTGYILPEQYVKQVEVLKENNTRLKYAKVVVVALRSGKALLSGEPVSSVYNPRLGWGENLSREE